MAQELWEPETVPMVGFSVDLAQIETILGPALLEGERALCVFLCRLEERSVPWLRDLVVLTDRRLILLLTGMRETSVRDFAYSDLSRIEPYEVRSEVNTGALEFHAGRKKYHLGKVKRSNLDVMLRVLQGRVAGAENLSQIEVTEKATPAEGKHQQKYKERRQARGRLGLFSRFPGAS
ncbi:MAG: PH domain-containing protein [Magnetococcales bacterium]|nr:PH domain-containing protein [Magnetococcales bacterium]